jgi:hypothetical protein
MRKTHRIDEVRTATFNRAIISLCGRVRDLGGKSLMTHSPNHVTCERCKQISGRI